jgi:ADP-ribose pyrophosphatase YjhB (NUDIX family)
MPEFRDAQRRRLEDYPRPSVAVDTAVLTLEAGRGLSVVLTRHDSGPRLPGTFLHPGETLANAVTRSLRDKAGLEGLAPTQLHVFDNPTRDDRGWVLSVAHFDTVSPNQLRLGRSITDLWPVERLPALPYDHDLIVARAVEALRAEYRKLPDPRHLLPEAFTLRELHAVHEVIAGTALGRDTFRRTMRKHLEETGGRTTGVVGKPARLLTRKEG